jgi:hypothetical protein
MNSVTFEIENLHVTLIEYPQINARKPWVNKMLQMMESKFPKIIHYISKQKVLAHLSQFRICIRSNHVSQKATLRIFAIWLQKEKLKRLIFMVLEAILLPFTGLLVVLPGPNFFFFIPATLLYFHFISYKGLRSAKFNQLDIEIIPNNCNFPAN